MVYVIIKTQFRQGKLSVEKQKRAEEIIRPEFL